MNETDRELIREFIKIGRERLAKLDATIYGNGRPGLVTQVYLLMWCLGVTSTAVVVFLGGVAAGFWR
jgi:hypothetical protein